jgi:stalled ribosome alternative rescue factor ArfA
MFDLRDIMALIPPSTPPQLGGEDIMSGFRQARRDRATREYQEGMISNEQARQAEEKRKAQAQLQFDIQKYEQEHEDLRKENRAKKYQALADLLKTMNPRNPMEMALMQEAINMHTAAIAEDEGGGLPEQAKSLLAPTVLGGGVAGGLGQPLTQQQEPEVLPNPYRSGPEPVMSPELDPNPYRPGAMAPGVEAMLGQIGLGEQQVPMGGVADQQLLEAAQPSDTDQEYDDFVQKHQILHQPEPQLLVTPFNADGEQATDLVIALPGKPVARIPWSTFKGEEQELAGDVIADVQNEDYEGAAEKIMKLSGDAKLVMNTIVDNLFRLKLQKEKEKKKSKGSGPRLGKKHWDTYKTTKDDIRQDMKNLEIEKVRKNIPMLENAYKMLNSNVKDKGAMHQQVLYSIASARESGKLTDRDVQMAGGILGKIGEWYSALRQNAIAELSPSQVKQMNELLKALLKSNKDIFRSTYNTMGASAESALYQGEYDAYIQSLRSTYGKEKWYKEPSNERFSPYSTEKKTEEKSTLGSLVDELEAKYGGTE